MAVLDRYLLESSTTDGYLLEDGSGVLLLDTSIYRNTILADGPVAYWRLGESAGLRAYDETANNNADVKRSIRNHATLAGVQDRLHVEVKRLTGSPAQ